MRILFFLMILCASSAQAVESSDDAIFLITTAAGNIGINEDVDKYIAVSLYSPFQDREARLTQTFFKMGLFTLRMQPDRKDNNYRDSYIGYSVGIGASLNYSFSPYGAVGFVVGNNRYCDKNNDNCEENTMLGVYSEAGIMFNSRNVVVVQLFVRNYSLYTHGVQKFMAAGLSFSFGI